MSCKNPGSSRKIQDIHLTFCPIKEVKWSKKFPAIPVLFWKILEQVVDFLIKKFFLGLRIFLGCFWFNYDGIEKKMFGTSLCWCVAVPVAHISQCVLSVPLASASRYVLYVVPLICPPHTRYI